MADKEISQFTNGNTPNTGDFVGGYLATGAGTPGANRRWSFTNILSFIATNLSGTLDVDISGNAATVTTNADLTGDVTSTGNAATLDNSAVTGQVITGFSSGAGTVAATDTILEALNKLDGNATAISDGLGTIASQDSDSVAITGGTILGTTVGKVTITEPATGATLTIVDGKTLTASNTLTFSGTDTSTVACGAGGTVAYLDTANVFTKAQASTPVAITSDTNHTATDASLGNIFTAALSEDTTLDNPTNLTTGAIYRWEITQDATPRTLAFGALFKWPAGVPLIVSTGSGAVDIIESMYDGTSLNTVVIGQAFA